MAMEGKGLLRAFLQAGFAKADLLKREFQSIPAIKRLREMSRPERDARFKEKKTVEVPFRTHQRLKSFQREYYAVVDKRFFELEGEATTPEDTSLPKEITIDTVTQIIDEARDAMQQARTAARDVLNRLGKPERGLGGLWLPREGFAKDVTDWLEHV
jgi:hypothetical protein